jgi:hypothetical protein
MVPDRGYTFSLAGMWVNPQGETVLNDTCAIELCLGSFILAGNEVWSRGVPRPRCRGHQLRTSLLVQPEDQPQRTLAGQAVGVKQVDHGIWLVSFMDYDLGYLDLEQKTLQPLENPFGPKV